MSYYEYYEGYGAEPPTEKAHECARLIERVYEWSAVGGGLHNVLDDWNLEDDSIRWCMSDKNDPLTDDEMRCAECLLELRLEQRAAALALFERSYCAF